MSSVKKAYRRMGCGLMRKQVDLVSRGLKLSPLDGDDAVFLELKA